MSVSGQSDAMTLLSRVRRRLALARWAQVLMLSTVGMSLAAGALAGFDWLVWGALALAMVWIFLVVRSARLVRRVRQAWGALQLGRADLAELGARQVAEMPSLLRPATVTALAVLAGALARQQRHAEAAQLAAYVLSRSERLLAWDRAGVQMLLAESLLWLGQLEAARVSMMPLYGPRLPLADSLALLLLQLRVEARMGAWPSMLERLGSKVDMVELMPAQPSALGHALLGLAAARSGLEQWAHWLWRRTELLCDWEALFAREPALANLGAGFAPRAPSAASEVSTAAPEGADRSGAG